MVTVTLCHQRPRLAESLYQQEERWRPRYHRYPSSPARAPGASPFVFPYASRSFSLKQVTAKLPTDQISAQATRVAEYAKERITYGGVDYVELAVDTETGRVHIEKVFGAPALSTLDPAAQDGQANDLMNAFDFNQTPLKPLILQTRLCL